MKEARPAAIVSVADSALIAAEFTKALGAHLRGNEESWLVTDEGTIDNISSPHLLVITNQRLLAVGSTPHFAVVTEVDRSEATVAFSNLSETRLKRVGRDLARSQRTVTIRWRLGGNQNGAAFLLDLMRNVTPIAVLASAVTDATLLTDCVYLGGHGCSVPKGTPGALFFARELILFRNGTGAQIWQTETAGLTEVEIGGPGAWQKGGRTVGGGFGLAGAAEGLILAGAMNALTMRRGVTTIIKLGAGEEMTTFWRHDVLTPDQVRIQLSAIVASADHRRRSRDASSQQTPDSVTAFVAKIRELAALKTEGLLTEEEFSTAKARLLGDT